MIGKVEGRWIRKDRVTAFVEQRGAAVVAGDFAGNMMHPSVCFCGEEVEAVVGVFY